MWEKFKRFVKKYWAHIVAFIATLVSVVLGIYLGRSVRKRNYRIPESGIDGGILSGVVRDSIRSQKRGKYGSIRVRLEEADRALDRIDERNGEIAEILGRLKE